jgi:hypothetical protein
VIDGITVVAIAVVPPAARERYSDATIRAALLGLVVRGKLPDAELLALLPYTVGDLAGFRLLRASRDGTATFTLGPRDTPLPAEQPFFMLTLRGAEMPAPSERERFANGLLATLTGFGEFRVLQSGPLRIGGRQGFEIIGETRDTKLGTELAVAQWLLFGSRGYLQMLGIARRDAWDTALPRMRAIRDTVAPK